MLFWKSGLFRGDIEPSCLYCRRGARIRENEVACVKRGIVPADGSCRSFRYDPLKRVPPRPAVLHLGGLSAADFSLDDPSPERDALPETAGGPPALTAPGDPDAGDAAAT